MKEDIFKEYLILKGFTKSTREKILQINQRFASWSQSQNIELLQISYNDVMAYVQYGKQQGNKARTLQITVGYIKHYYNFLIHEQELTENPCSNIEIKGVKRKHLYETFSPEELHSLYQAYTCEHPLVCKRNKVILGLMVYQGLATEELARLTIHDLQLREGKITIQEAKRSNARDLTLESHQLYELMDYTNETRKLFLALRGKTSDALFLSLGQGDRFHNMLSKLLVHLKKQNKKVKDIKQLRASVITNWLKVHNIRKVQYLAGHRYVSSTEAYQANNLDGLKEEVNKYHPDL